MLQQATVINKPDSRHTIGENNGFAFQANAEYVNYSIYFLRVVLTINNEVIYLRRVFDANGYLEFSINQYLEPFFNTTLNKDGETKIPSITYKVEYTTATELESSTSPSLSSFSLTVFNIKLPENLMSFLIENNQNFIEFCKARGLMLNPLVLTRKILTTRYLKKEYFSFISESVIKLYTIEFTLLDNVVSTQSIKVLFLPDTIYTLDVTLEKANVKSFKVTVGSIYQEYLVETKSKKQSYNLVFVNSYNLLDSIELSGEAKQKAVLSKLNYFRNDVQKSYDNKYKFEYIFNTQYFNSSANFNLLEFVNSKQVWLKIKNNWEELSLDIGDFELNEDGVYFQTNEIKAVTSRLFDRFLTDKIEGLTLNAAAFSDNFTLNDDAGDEYTMFFRTVVNPKNNNIGQTWKLAYSHTIILKYFYFRISKDGGATFRSIDGTAAYSKVNVTDWINNPTPVYTKTGRLIMFFQYSATSSSSRSKACYIYSDDDGLTWSSMNYFTDPVLSGITITGNAYFYSNKILYNSAGELLIPYWLRIVETGRSSLRIAKSSNNGQSWSDSVCVFQNATGTKMEMTESEWVDVGSGQFVMIIRTSQFANLSGDVVPAIFFSSDYGATWRTGGTPHTVESVAAKENKSGFLYLEGAGVSLGVAGATFNEPLPSINLVTVNNEKYLVIFYWIRLANEAVYQFTVQKWTAIKVSDFLSQGVDAVRNSSLILYDGTNHGGANANGGNGCADNYGDELVFSSYTQDTSYSSGGITTMYHLILRKSQIETLINSYTNAI